MARTKTRPWDVVNYLRTEEDQVAYLEAALEEDDATMIAEALDDIARARGGEGETFREALSQHGGTDFAMILEAVRALGLRLHAGPIAARR